MSLTKTELLKKIAALAIDEETKAALADKMSRMSEEAVLTEGMDTVLDAIQEKVDAKQDEVDALYQEAGVADNEQDSEYRAAFDTMMTEIDGAQQELGEKLSALEAEAENIVAGEEEKQAGDLLQKIKGE